MCVRETYILITHSSNFPSSEHLRHSTDLIGQKVLITALTIALAAKLNDDKV